MSGNKTTFPIELGTAKKGATYRTIGQPQMRVVTMPANSVQPSGGTTQIIQTHLMPQAMLKTDQGRTQIAIPSRSLNQTASITMSRPQTPSTYQIQRGTTMTGLHTPRCGPIPLRTQTPPSGLTTNITPTFVRTTIPPRTSSPAAPQWLSTVGPAGSVVQLPTQLITRNLTQSPRARVVTQTIPSVTSSTGGTITANVVTQQTLGMNQNSNNQQLVSSGGSGQQQTFVATLATVLPPRQQTATLVYSTSQQQQYSVQPQQRLAVTTSLGTVGATRQVRPTIQRLPTTGIGVRVSSAIRPSVPVLTPTVLTSLSSSNVRNTVSTSNLSNTIPARIIQVQPQSGGNTQVIGQGRLHNLMTLQPIVVNANRLSHTVKPIQSQLTIAQLNKHNLISSGGTITTTSNLSHSTTGNTVNLNIGSQGQLLHQQQQSGSNMQQQHATLMPTTNLITTNQQGQQLQQQQQQQQQSQQHQHQQISFNQTGGNQSHQIVTVTQHQMLPNQSGTTTVLPLTITSRNTTTVPVNVSIGGLSGSGQNSTINVVASNNLGSNILRSISTTTSNNSGTSANNLLPIAKVLPQQQQIIGISNSGDQQQQQQQHQIQQQNIVTSLHNLGNVGGGGGGGLWTARSTNATTMRIPGAHQIGQLTATTASTSTISAASTATTGSNTSGFVVGGGIGINSSSSHSGGAASNNNNINNNNNTINLNNSITSHPPHTATFLQTAGGNTTIFYEHIANNNNNNLNSLTGISAGGSGGHQQHVQHHTVPTTAMNSNSSGDGGHHHMNVTAATTPRTTTTTTTTYSTTNLNQNMNSNNYATIATTTHLNSIFNSLNNATATTNTTTLSSNNNSATTNLNQNNSISNIKQIMISSSIPSNNSTSNLNTISSGAQYKPTAGSFVAVPASNRGQQVHGITNQIQTVPVRFNPQLLVDNGSGGGLQQQNNTNNSLTVSSSGGTTTHQIITLQPNLQQSNANNMIIHQQQQQQSQPPQHQQQQQPQTTHVLIPVGSTSGGPKLTTTTVASSRSSILRKRDKEGSPIKAARTLNLSSQIIPITQPPSINTQQLAQQQHQSLVSSVALIQEQRDRAPSPHSRPGSTDGSTTVSANSSPGVDQQEEHEEMYIQGKHHLMRLHHAEGVGVGEGYKTLGEMYPPPSSRPYPMQNQNSTSSSSNGNADNMVTPRKKPRKQQHASNENSRPIGNASSGIISKEKMVLNNKELRPSQPHEVTVKKPQTVSLLQCYKQSWKAANNHFQRYSDVRPRDERRPTVMDLANQAHVLQKVNGWKIYHLSAQIEELCELETKAYDNLSTMLQAMETHEKDEEVDRVNELLKGNMQRSKIIVDGITEARTQLMKIFDHKTHVSDIIHRCASKRNFKKREKT